MLCFSSSRARDLVRLRARQRMSGRRHGLANAVKHRPGLRPLSFSWRTSSGHISLHSDFADLARCYAPHPPVSMNTPTAYERFAGSFRLLQIAETRRIKLRYHEASWREFLAHSWSRCGGVVETPQPNWSQFQPYRAPFRGRYLFLP